MQERDQKYFPWEEGQSTDPDVDALMKAFQPEELKVGRHISDEQVRAVLGPLRDDRRCWTISDAWRRRLLGDHGINLFRENTVGFFVPTAEEVFARTRPTLQHMERAARKQMRHLAATKVENDQQRMVKQHLGRLTHSIAREIKKARMNMLPSTATPEPVRRLPPNEVGRSGKA